MVHFPPPLLSIVQPQGPIARSLPIMSACSQDVFQPNARICFGVHKVKPTAFSEAEKAEAQRFLIHGIPEYRQDLDWACAVNRVVKKMAETVRRHPRVSAQIILTQMTQATQAALLQPLLPEKKEQDFKRFEDYVQYSVELYYAKSYGAVRTKFFLPSRQSIYFNEKYKVYQPKADKTWKQYSQQKLHSQVYARYTLSTGSEILLSSLGLSPIGTQIHPDPKKPFYGITSIKTTEIPLVLTEVDVVFERIKAIGKQLGRAEKKQGISLLNSLVLETAKIHWLLSHAWPYERGSGSTADMFTKVIFDTYGIKTPRWKNRTDPNIHALLTPEVEVFQNEYADLFEKNLLDSNNAS